MLAAPSPPKRHRVSDEFRRIEEFDREVGRWLSNARTQFFFINEDRDLTPEDKQRIKEYYLETCMTSRIKEALKRHFPEDFSADKVGTGDWTFFSRIQTNQRPLPIETNLWFHKGWKCQRSVCFIQAGNESLPTGSHDCRVFRGNRGFVREIPELPTIKRNLRVQSWLPKMSKL